LLAFARFCLPGLNFKPPLSLQHASKLGMSGAEVSAKVDAAAKSAVGSLFGSKVEQPPAQE
jgi:hypothetical protein